MQKREMDKLVHMCWDQGWWCERGKKNYVRVFCPDGQGTTSIPSTPSGPRTYINKLEALKRLGLQVDGT
jgi:hypothetical protein